MRNKGGKIIENEGADKVIKIARTMGTKMKDFLRDLDSNVILESIGWTYAWIFQTIPVFNHLKLTADFKDRFEVIVSSAHGKFGPQKEYCCKIVLYFTLIKEFQRFTKNAFD